MSINNELPREIENAIRQVLDDDLFVDQARGLLACYHDLRGMELIQIPLNDAKKKADGVLTALHSLELAVNYADYIVPPRELKTTITKMKAYYSGHLDNFNRITTRKTRHNAMRNLARNLLSLYESNDISPRHISGLIIVSLPMISPEMDKSPPSQRMIELAVKEAKENRK